MSSSSRSGNRISSWRFAPWIKPMQVQHSKRAKPFLVVVHRAIVYQIIEFSPSLALHLTAYSVRDAGLRRRQAFAVGRPPAVTRTPGRECQ